MHHHLCLQMLAYLVELSPVVFVLLVAVYVTVDRYLYRYLTIFTISTISTSTTAACAARRASCLARTGGGRAPRSRRKL